MSVVWIGEILETLLVCYSADCGYAIDMVKQLALRKVKTSIRKLLSSTASYNV